MHVVWDVRKYAESQIQAVVFTEIHLWKKKWNILYKNILCLTSGFTVQSWTKVLGHAWTGTLLVEAKRVLKTQGSAQLRQGVPPRTSASCCTFVSLSQVSGLCDRWRPVGRPRRLTCLLSPCWGRWTPHFSHKASATGPMNKSAFWYNVIVSVALQL